MGRLLIHPGDHLADELMALGMSANELAKELGVPTHRLTQIIAGKRGITGDTATRPLFQRNTRSAVNSRNGCPEPMSQEIFPVPLSRRYCCGQSISFDRPLAIHKALCYKDFRTICWRSSMAEQLICNQQVGGSTPFASFNKNSGLWALRHNPFSSVCI